MATLLRATAASGPARLTRGCLGLCFMTLAAVGCASSNATVSGPLASATPSFMLSDQEKAERNLKDPASLHMAYGRFEEQIGQPGEAHKYYEKALAENPHAVEAVIGIARLDQLADKPKEAEAGFQRALAMKPGDAAVMAACGQFYASQKRWPEAVKHLNAAIAAAPKVAIYKHQLAVAATHRVTSTVDWRSSISWSDPRKLTTTSPTCWPRTAARTWRRKNAGPPWPSIRNSSRPRPCSISCRPKSPAIRAG